jgi:hypothetical protein
VSLYVDLLDELLDGERRRPPLDWQATEVAVGAAIPADYRELIERIGAGVVDDWLRIYGPQPDNLYVDLAQIVRDRDEAWATFREYVDLPERYFADGHRLLAFASVEENWFLWHLVPDVPPEQWGVVFVDADMEGWHDFDMNASACLYEVLTGAISLEYLENYFPGPRHQFTPMPAEID